MCRILNSFPSLPTIFHIYVPEESRMYGHTGHGVFIGHEEKGFQVLKPALTIQPRAVPCSSKGYRKSLKLWWRVTQSLLQVNFLESGCSDKTAARYRETAHIGNSETNSNSSEVEKLTLLTSSHLQRQGGLGIRAEKVKIIQSSPTRKVASPAREGELFQLCASPIQKLKETVTKTIFQFHRQPCEAWK